MLGEVLDVEAGDDLVRDPVGQCVLYVGVVGEWAHRRDIAVGVFDDANAILLRPLVALRPKVRVAFNDEQPPLGIEIDGDGMDDIWRRGELNDFEPRIERTGVGVERLPDCLRSIKACRTKGKKESHRSSLSEV